MTEENVVKALLKQDSAIEFFNAGTPEVLNPPSVIFKYIIVNIIAKIIPAPEIPKPISAAVAAF